MQPTCAILFLLFRSVVTDFQCHDTEITIGDALFNVNHLKDHRPPYQTYSDKSNIYGKENSGNNYTFFNLANFVQTQDIDNHIIASRCQPRSNKLSTITNKPAACSPEIKENCDENPCWIALGSCDQMKPTLIDENDVKKGLHLKYNAGDYKVCLTFSSKMSTH
jgi:hypothetical protein